MRTVDEIKEFLEDLNDIDILYIWREYTNKNGYYDDEIYSSDEFDDIMGNISPTDLAYKIFYGDFNPNHNYWCFNGYANLKSSDYLDDLISFYDLAEYICDNDDDFDNDNLREFLDGGEDNND